MKLSRRQFTSTALFGAFVSVLPLALMGCGIFSDILTWTAVAGVALDGIVTVLGNFMPPGGGALITAIKSFLTDLAGAVTEYQNDTNPADRATLLAKIRTLLGDIATNFQNFLSQINLGNNPIVAVVLGLAQVILAAIAGFLGQLPTTGTRMLSSTMTINGKTVTVVPKYYKRVADFRKDYDAVAVANGHPEIQI
jgi:hypothetical protein